MENTEFLKGRLTGMTEIEDLPEFELQMDRKVENDI